MTQSITKDLVNHFLKEWDKEELDNIDQIISKVFKLFNSNNKYEDVLARCCVLNTLYSTSIKDIKTVARHISNLNLENKFNTHDISKVVNMISKIKMKNNKIYCFYSFATKYCSFNFPNKYFIYDSYVDEVLWYLKKTNNFYNFKRKDLKNYEYFYNIMNKFINFYGLEKYSKKEIDKFLWLFGKKYFSKQNLLK